MRLWRACPRLNCKRMVEGKPSDVPGQENMAWFHCVMCDTTFVGFVSIANVARILI